MEKEIIHAINIFAPFIKKEGIDSKKLLWAIAGAESHWGNYLKKRVEHRYAPGGKYYLRSKRIQKAYELYEIDACASVGIWQIMYPTAMELGFEGSPDELHKDIKLNCEYATKYILGRCSKCTTVQQIADAYNSGNAFDRNIPETYINKVCKYYAATDSNIFIEEV